MGPSLVCLPRTPYKEGRGTACKRHTASRVMQPATYASVAHVGWERSIRWEAPDDDDAAERAAPVVGGDARVASGAWTRAIRWDGDQTAAPSDETTHAPATRTRARARVPRAGGPAVAAARGGEPAPAQGRERAAGAAAPLRERGHGEPRPGALPPAARRPPAAAGAVAPRGARAVGGAARRAAAAGAVAGPGPRRDRAGDGDLFVGELSEERPGLVANPGMSFALCRLRRGVEGRASDDDDDRDGVAVDLGMEAPSPLLGNLPEPGRELLVGVSNLQRRPVFPHASRDFLLCLRPRLRKDLGKAAEVAWTCRPLRKHVVAALGQGEPRIEVPPAGSKRYAALQEPLAAFHIARALLAKSSAAKGDVKHATFPASDLGRALFASAPAPLALVKRAAAEVAGAARRARRGAEERRGRGPLDAPGPGGPARRRGAALRARGRCAYESASASLKRLKHLGLRRPQLLGGPAGVAPACRKLFEVKRAADARAKDLETRARATRAPRRPSGTVRGGPAALRGGGRDAPRRDARARGAELRAGAPDERVLRRGPEENAARRAAARGPGDPSGCGDAFSFARSTLRELRRGDVIHKASGQAVKEAYDERVNAIARRQRHALSGRGHDGAHVEDDALKDLRGGFVGRGARGPTPRPAATTPPRRRRRGTRTSGGRAGRTGGGRRRGRRRPGGPRGGPRAGPAAGRGQGRGRAAARVVPAGPAAGEQRPAGERAAQVPRATADAAAGPRARGRRGHVREQFARGRPGGAADGRLARGRRRRPRAGRAAGRPTPGAGPQEAHTAPRGEGGTEETHGRRQAQPHETAGPRRRYKAEAKRQKAEQQRAEAAAYHRPVAKREGPRADAQNKPHVQLAKLLRQECLNPMYARPGCRPFVRPVSTKTFPLYKTKIAKPMDLSTIKSRLERYVYRDREGHGGHGPDRDELHPRSTAPSTRSPRRPWRWRAQRARRATRSTTSWARWSGRRRP